MRSRWLMASVALGALVAAAPDARAQTPEGWAFGVTPYIWITGISGNSSLNTRRDGTVTGSASADFNNLFDSMRFAAMGSAEVRYGRFGVLADLILLDLSQGVDTGRDPRVNGGSASMRTTAAGLAALYRVVDEPMGWIDIGAGIRPWWIDTSITLNPGAGPGRYASQNFSWTDPIFAARGQLRLGDRFALTAYGDFGGFNVGSRFTYQVLGTIDWNAYSWMTVRAGYRQMAFDFENGNGKLNITLGGPIVAATFRF